MTRSHGTLSNYQVHIYLYDQFWRTWFCMKATGIKRINKLNSEVHDSNLQPLFVENRMQYTRNHNALCNGIYLQLAINSYNFYSTMRNKWIIY